MSAAGIEIPAAPPAAGEDVEPAPSSEGEPGAVGPTAPGSPAGEIIDLACNLIGPGPDVRSERIDLDHVAALREVIDAPLPPIVVRLVGGGYRLVDGQHRLSAHKFENRPTIRAVVVSLSDGEALEQATRLNREHGKPLSVGERKSAAKRLLDLSPDWANARVAASVGLAPATVDSLRPPSCPGSHSENLDTRKGSDDKSYPANKAAREQLRRDIVAAIARDPEASNRKIAEQVGGSTMTVIKVRAEIVEPEPADERESTSVDTPDPVEPPAEPEKPGLALVPPAPDGVSVGDVLTTWPSPGTWAKTAEFQTSNSARDVGRFMDRRVWRDDDPTPETIARDCPASHRAGLAMAARIEAGAWLEVAHQLEGNARPMEAG